MYRQSSLKASILAGVTFFTAGCSTVRTDGPGRADYLAGLSAYDMGDNERARLRLTLAAKTTVARTLDLIGIDAPETM